MNRIFIIVVFISILIAGFYYYKKSTSSMPQTPSPTPLIPKFVPVTPAPITTLYPLTEQTILLNFQALPSNPYSTTYSKEIFTDLFTKQQTKDILVKMSNDGKKIYPPTFTCYALYTNVFTNSYISNMTPDPYAGSYDVVGAYFFATLKNYLSPSSLSSITYYDFIKKIVIPADVLQEIMNYWNIDSKNSFFFSGGEMPMLLDDFVPRISRYLFTNYASKTNITNQALTYTNLKKNC